MELQALKSTLDEIRARFDKDVERFSNLETGQTATMDAVLCMELIALAATAVTPRAASVLDIGCGAGNYTLKILDRISPLDCTLLDLSRPMLDRAVHRIRPRTTGRVTPIQSDMLSADFGVENFDIVLAASTLHHLRDDLEWDTLFQKVHAALRPGGSFWIFDLIIHEGALDTLMRERYGRYLAGLKGGGPEGDAYRNHVFAYIEQEDSPRPLLWQIGRMQAAGFKNPEILHKNACFAAFGAVK